MRAALALLVLVLVLAAGCGPAPLELEAELIAPGEDARPGPCPGALHERNYIGWDGAAWHGCWCRAPLPPFGADFVFALAPQSAERERQLRTAWREYAKGGCVTPKGQ